MSPEELQRRVADLEKERDTWREMAVSLLKYLPPPPPPRAPGLISPDWPFTPATPIGPMQPPYDPLQPWGPVITYGTTT